MACPQNGRVKGEPKKALRNVIERYELPVTITPNQNLILRDINPSWKDDILSTLKVGRRLRGKRLLDGGGWLGLWVGRCGVAG